MKNRKDFEAQVDWAATTFQDARLDKVYLISHNDADGFASLEILKSLCARKQIQCQDFIYNREQNWSEYLSPLLLKKHDKTAFILTDLGGELSEIGKIFDQRPEQLFVLDHHFPQLSEHPLPENMYVCNPVQYNFDGLKEIAGAAVAYLFAKQVDLGMIKYAWLAAIGIAGDSLMHVNELRSFNKEIVEEAITEDQIQVKAGACLYGGTHEKVKTALTMSILPYLPQVKSNLNEAEKILRRLGINAEKKVEFLEDHEVRYLADEFGSALNGAFAILPQKKGILRYAFEHALLLNVLGFKHQNEAVHALAGRQPSALMNKVFVDHVTNLSKNLTTFANLARQETQNTVMMDVQGILPPSAWSDTASFASVNKIFDPRKMLFLAGREDNKVKFSVRCSRDFIDSHEGDDVSKVIVRIKKDFNASGGGHMLAGGLKLDPADLDQFKQTVEKYIQKT